MKKIESKGRGTRPEFHYVDPPFCGFVTSQTAPIYFRKILKINSNILWHINRAKHDERRRHTHLVQVAAAATAQLLRKWSFN